MNPQVEIVVYDVSCLAKSRIARVSTPVEWRMSTAGARHDMHIATAN